MSYLEIVAVAVSILGIWMVARRMLASWPVTLLACVIYFKIFFDARLYADMALQAIFAAAILYGWVVWAMGKRDEGEVVITPLARSHLAMSLAAGALGAVSIGWFTSTHTDAAVPWLDAALTSFSIVAQVWTARRKAASWLLWIVLDVIYVGMFIYKDLLPTAALYAVMVALAVHGYRGWSRAEASRAST